MHPEVTSELLGWNQVLRFELDETAQPRDF